MKYVIFKKEDEIGETFYPILMPEHITHSSVKIEENEKLTVYSAGFCYIDQKTKLLKVDKEKTSISLKIGPKKGDFYILNNIILETGIYGFQNYKD